MIGREKRVLLRHYLEQGMNKAVIARDLGVSRRTVYHWIETGQLDRELDEERVGYGPRCLMPSKLDPYKPLIDTRLKEYPKLTAVRLFKEVRAAGYPGSYNQVKRYVRKVRPRPPEEPVVRFETAPGRQGQVDFAHFRLPWGKRYALIVVLGYSRLLWVQFYTRQTMKALMHGLESSFSYFGGVPSELLFDQMKAVVIEDGRYDDGALVENPEFMRYAYHWNFRIRACRPYRAQTKGKVERPIRYLRESFFYGRTFTSDDDLNAQALHWLETEANVRSHGTLKERPLDRFERERLLLEPLATRPYHPLADLKMPGALEAIDDVLTGVDGGGVTASEAIEQLLGAQITLRNNRRLQAAMRSSRLPGIKTLDDFDFSFQPSIKREQIDSLHELGFLERKENVIFLGPPGVGKTHLAISLAIAAAQSGRRVYYSALADLITSLEEAKTTGQLGRRLKILTYPSLLVIDEIGYLPVSQTGAMLFFQLINRRYERASTVLTSNKGFEEWGQILGDEVMAAALIDRLLHHRHIVNIRGSSYRMRKHTDLSKILHSPPAESSPSPPKRKRARAKEKTTN